MLGRPNSFLPRLAAPPQPAQSGRHRARCAAPADVDETPKRGEFAARPAPSPRRAKADAALKSVQLDDELRGASFSRPTPWSRSARRILPKAGLVDEASQCLRLLSGRNHRVYTAICLVTRRRAFASA